MTLTAIIPSLRRVLPDPLAVDRWPAHTHATPADVVVEGVSMLRIVELCETPCVHSATAVIAGTGGRPLADGCTTVAMVSVVAVDRSGAVAIDGRLVGVAADWGQARLIGRVSPARAVPMRVTDAGGAVALLPADLRDGDVIAIPCDGIVVRRQLRPSAVRGEA